MAIAKQMASDGQVGTAGGTLMAPLTVQVTAEDGTRAVRAAVRWTVVGGTGALLSDTVTVSDGLGEAQVWLTLGPTEGLYEVEAELKAARGQLVVFEAFAAAPVRVSSVTPTVFTAGQAVTLTGTGFTDSTTVRIGGRPAEVTTVGATRQAMGVIVPPCLIPGPVQVVASQGGAMTTPLVATYEASTFDIDLAPGAYVTLPAEQVAECAVFPPIPGTTARYLVVPQSTTSLADQVGSFALGSDSMTTMVPLDGSGSQHRTHAQQFHDWLREREAEITRMPRTPLEQPELAPTLSVQVGDQRRFKVCSSVRCMDPEDFPEVTARAKYVGKHAVIYEDVQTPQELTEAEVDTLGRIFDEDLYEVASRAFGAESDVDRNGVTFILITPTVNRLTPKSQCSESIITGFFFPADLDPAFRNSAFSNQAEIFYAQAPDPSASVTCQVLLANLKRRVPVTFVHELQHMISFHQHVLLRGGDREQLWLNEGMSHLAEELGGRRFLDRGDTVGFSRMVVNNVSNGYKYLRAPQESRLVSDTGFATLTERGASWLFVRWLADQFGDQVVRRLSESGLRGAVNVEAATGESFGTLVSDWFLANYVSDHETFAAPTRLQYTSWRFRATWGGLHEQNRDLYPVPFPIVPAVVTGGDFLFVVTLRSGSGDYYLVEHPAGLPGFTLRLEHVGGSSTRVAPVVSVARIQ